MPRRAVVTALVLAAIAGRIASAEDVETAAARERERRAHAARETPTVYSNESLHPRATPTDKASASGTAAPTARATETPAASAATPRPTATDDIPTCDGSSEALAAWSEASRKIQEVCVVGGPEAETTGEFHVDMILSETGVVEEAHADPENVYTTCFVQQLRGMSLPPSGRGRCRQRYATMWRS